MWPRVRELLAMDVVYATAFLSSRTLAPTGRGGRAAEMAVLLVDAEALSAASSASQRVRTTRSCSGWRKHGNSAGRDDRAAVCGCQAAGPSASGIRYAQFCGGSRALKRERGVFGSDSSLAHPTGSQAFPL